MRLPLHLRILFALFFPITALLGVSEFPDTDPWVYQFVMSILGWRVDMFEPFVLTALLLVCFLLLRLRFLRSGRRIIGSVLALLLLALLVLRSGISAYAIYKEDRITTWEGGLPVEDGQAAILLLWLLCVVTLGATAAELVRLMYATRRSVARGHSQ